MLQHVFPHLHGFIGIGRAEGQEIRDGTQRSDVLGGLVCGAVFAHANAVVCQHKDTGIL